MHEVVVSEKLFLRIMYIIEVLVLLQRVLSQLIHIIRLHVVVRGNVIADIQRMEIHVRRIVQYVEQWWHEMDEQEHVMLIMHRHEHVVHRREHVMMEQHHEVMDILTVMHDVRSHGIMNI